MSRNRLFDGRESERNTVAYRTYDERRVSRDDIERAIWRADGTRWLSGPLFLILLGVLFAVATALVLWLMYH